MLYLFGNITDLKQRCAENQTNYFCNIAIYNKIRICVRLFVTVFIRHELHLDIFDKKMQANQINVKSYEDINVKFKRKYLRTTTEYLAFLVLIIKI